MFEEQYYCSPYWLKVAVMVSKFVNLANTLRPVTLLVRSQASLYAKRCELKEQYFAGFLYSLFLTTFF